MKLKFALSLFAAAALFSVDAQASSGYLSGFSGSYGYSRGDYLSDYRSGYLNTTSGNYTRGFQDRGQSIGGRGSNLGFIDRNVTYSNKHGSAFRAKWYARQEFLAEQEALLNMSQIRTVYTKRGKVAPTIYQGTQGNFARLAATRSPQKAALDAVLGTAVVVPQ